MYHLTESDLREFSGPEGRPAIIRASKSPHARILEALLKLNDPEKSASRFLEAETAGYYTSALHEAIKAKRSANVSLLLAHGADPNGLPLDCFSRCSVGLHRLRNLRWSSASSNFPVSPSKEEALAKILQKPQTVPLTAEEVEARRSMRARCWTEASIPASGPGVEAMTALEAAAVIGDIESIDKLLEAGADTAARTLPYDSIPFDASVSYFSTSTPLQRAIEHNQLATIEDLLNLGFSPNIYPLASITCTLTPAMTAIATQNLPAFRLIAQAPSTDLTLTTPIYDISPLHLAVATLSLSLLHTVTNALPLNAAMIPRPTALRHNLLHIASLPLDDTHINHHSAKCHASLHEIRCLDRTTQDLTLHPCRPPNQLLKIVPSIATVDPSSLSLHHPAQTAMLQHLLETYPSLPVHAQDLHGNTPLHYLAGQRVINTESIDLSRSRQSSEEHDVGTKIWAESRNRWGFTPQELFEDGEKVRASGEAYMPFWRDRMGYWRGGRWVDLLPPLELGSRTR